MPPANTPLPKCPNCNSIVPRGKTRCVSCGMEVAVMENYRRAAAAAAAKFGGKSTVVLSTERQGGEGSETEKAPPAWARPVKVGGSVVAAALVLLVLVYFGGKVFGKAEPWRNLPTDPKEAVTTYVKLIADDGNKASHVKAYTMIASSAKNPENKKDSDLFLQYHHDIYRYLWSLTGEQNWIDSTKFEADANASDVYVVTVGPEVMHVQVVDEAPKEAQAKGEHHFAVMPIREIDPHSEARASSNAEEATMGMARAVGAGGVERTLRGIGALGQKRHETVMDKKMRVLPLLNQPYANDLDRHIIGLWHERMDPAVRWKLGQVVDDDRYGAITRERAKKVLDGSLDLDVEGAAVGVNP